jgi:hypothetical protein
MIKTTKADNLVNVKLALAEKYEHLAAVRRSAPLKAKLLRRAHSYRQQAESRRLTAR